MDNNYGFDILFEHGFCWNEPEHDKTNKIMCAQQGLVSLGVPPVWSVFAVCSMGSLLLVLCCGSIILIMGHTWAMSQENLSLGVCLATEAS